MSDLTAATRTIRQAPELRSGPDGSPGRYLVGYAARFGAESEVLMDPDVTDEDGSPVPFVEVIDPGAFTRTLDEARDIKALVNHDTSKVLGSTAAGTLVLTADGRGLAFKVDIPDTSYGRDARVSVGRGDIRGCSFRFYTIRDKVELRDGKPAIRTLLDVDIDEVSPVVTFPAYLDTEVKVRAKEDDRGKARMPRLDALRRRMRLIDLGIYRGRGRAVGGR